MEIKKQTGRNCEEIRRIFSESLDLQIREFETDGKQAAAVFLDGMCDEMKMTESIIKPLTDRVNFPLLGGTAEAIRTRAFKGLGIKETAQMEDAAQAVLQGNALLFLEGSETAFLFSMQGFPKKTVDAPETEQNEHGGRESFTDSFKDNITLLRRRLGTPKLVFEQTKIGETSHTEVVFCYLSDRADPAMLQKIKKRLEKTHLDALLGSGYLRPFLDKGSPALFSDTGFTERPDMLAAKLTEGRIGILVDGSPFALIVPYLFIDYFHSMDDYMCDAPYALFIRLLRLAAFLISTTLPGLFVATCNFHPEVLPSGIMLDIAAAETKTPFSLVFEAFAIHLIYEIVREAGLRMPVAVGHAVSIVGALVVGDAAVTAGLIAAPMLMVVAMTAISEAVVSKIHETTALIRFSLILLGGVAGFFGIFTAAGLLLAEICSTGPYGIPFSAPFSPFLLRAQNDALLRRNWRRLAKSRAEIRELELG